MFGKHKGKRKHRRVAIQTLVGSGTRIKGDLRFEGGCHIDGIVQGSVVADTDPEAYLSISEEGCVEGNVRVPRVVLNGKVQGDVYAGEYVELGETARVVGDLHYELLEMVAGAEVNGKLIHDSQITAAQSPAAAGQPAKQVQRVEAVAVAGAKSGG